MTTGGLSLLVIAAVLTVAVSVGEVIHRRRPPTYDDVHGGPRLSLLVDGVLTLAVVMCAFMLAVSYSAYNAANRDAGAEAGTVAGLYEAASVLPDRPTARVMQQDVICYARSVVADEWPRLGRTVDVSSRVESWRTQLRQDLLAAGSRHQDAALGAVRDADIARTTARQVRLVTSRQHAPNYLFALLMVVCGTAAALVTGFTIRGIPASLRRSIVGVLVGLLGLTLAVILDLDHPFIGFSTIGPDSLAQVAANSAADYTRTWHAPVSSCDAAGVRP